MIHVQAPPFGLSSFQDVFQRIMVDMFWDTDGVEVVVDDLLIWWETDEQHNKRLKQVLERVGQQNLKLNKSKCQLKTE